MRQLSKLFTHLGLVLILVGSLALTAQARDGNQGYNSDSSQNSTNQSGKVEATDTSGSDSIRDQIEKGQIESDGALAVFRAAKTTDDKLKALKDFGDKAANNRLGALTKLREQLASGFCSTIDATVKATILADITSVENTLKTQQTKIDDDTALTDGKTDVKAVFSANRVFAHFIPAVRGICVSERIIELVTNKITPAIAALNTAGKDTTQAATDAAAAKTAASDALTLYEKVAAAPGANTTNNPDLQTANTTLAKARASLAAVKTDLEKLKD